MKHTVRSMYAAAGVSIVGPVAYLSNKILSPQELGKIARWLPQESWFHELAGSVRFPAKPCFSVLMGGMALEVLHHARSVNGWIRPLDSDDPFSRLHVEQEPKWMGKLPPSIRRYLRCQFAMGEGTDPLGIVPKFPYMGFGYILPDDGIANEACQVFNLHRLGQIKQLSFLHDPVGKENDRSIGSQMFSHTRLCHSYDVHAVSNLIAHNLALDEVSLNTVITAGISHDSLTPAGGDSVKLIDPDAFDEDAHYPELLASEAWEGYRERYCIDEKLLVETINGNGLLGRILDISDKSSYLARDTQAYLGTVTPEKDMGDGTYYMVADIVTEDPYVCAVWESAHRREGSLVFGNTDRFARFLKLRALLFRGLYYNPYSRFFEYLVGKGAVKYLYQQGMVTREELLEHTDNWIERKIEKLLEAPYVLHKFHNLEHARIEEHPDMNTAMRRATEFDRDPSVLVIVDEFNVKTGNGTDRFLVRQGNNAVPFYKARPKDAETIIRIMTFPKMVRLYFFDMNDLEVPPKGRRRIKEIMKSVY